LRLYAERLRSTGFSVDQIRDMMQTNPERLLAHSQSICRTS
jgi:DNA-binding transcriptional MerR regulator